MKRHRDFDRLSEAQIAAGAVAARAVDGRAQNRLAAPRSVGELLASIEHVAEAATGERSFLHLKTGTGTGRGR